jgi:hypothetical protein
MRNLSEPGLEQEVYGRVRFNLKDTRQKPGAFSWWEPECDSAGSGDFGCTGDEPPLENGWAQPSAPLEKFAFRRHVDGSIEFKGHLDASGAASGTVAVTLPGANAGEVDFRPANDQYFVTIITTDDGATFTTAMVFIEATIGEITITWPAS